MTNHGSSGSRAPTANATNDDAAARTGRPERVGVDAELLAGVGLEREVGVAHELGGHRAGGVGVDAA